MGKRPDPLEVLKDLANRHGVRVRGLNLHDPIVARTTLHWREAIENPPPPPDRFRHQLKLRIDGRRVVVRANDRYVVVETRDVRSQVAFAVNRRDPYVVLLTERLPIAIGPKKLPVFVAEGYAGMPAIETPEIQRSIEGFDLGGDESLHVAGNEVSVYVRPRSVQRIIDVLNNVGPLIVQLPLAEDVSVDFRDLPSEFSHLIPLMRSWARSDDQHRSDRVERASTDQLLRLATKVAPHFAAINRYLDGFRERAVPASATTLANLAECAAEAQVVLAHREKPATRRARQLLVRPTVARKRRR
jgi:hypothetical protein